MPHSFERLRPDFRSIALGMNPLGDRLWLLTFAMGVRPDYGSGRTARPLPQDGTTLIAEHPGAGSLTEPLDKMVE